MSHAIYHGQVVHVRSRPKRHRLSYPVFNLALDLDDLEALNHQHRWIGYNRPRPLSVHDADHGDGTSLRNYVGKLLASHDLAAFSTRIVLVCFPRVLGYVFNPISVYFCYGPDGQAGVVVCEVANTHGERHSYVLPLAPAEGSSALHQSASKQFFVSPFIGMDCRYDFEFEPPGAQMAIRIRQSDADGPFLVASVNGVAEPLGDRAIRRALLRYPLMTLGVWLAIHFEAVKLWAKGFAIFDHRPALSRNDSSIHSPASNPERQS